MHPSRLLLFIFLGLLLFSVGFIGFNIYQDAHKQEIQNGAAPSQPSLK